MSKKGILKKRHWACFVYPDSAPENWRDILAQKGLQCAVSPLHDKDITAVEDEKKPHWHVIMCWPGPTTYNVALGITKELNAPIPQPLESVRGYYRYLTHKDDPDKYQYDEKDITTINGFSILDFVELTANERDIIKGNVLTIIRDKDIREYSVLLDYLQDSGLMKELSIAFNNTLLFTAYIKSRKHIHDMTTIKDQRITIDRLKQETIALRTIVSKQT